MLKPLGNKVLVQPKPEAEVTAGGIYVPDTAKKKSTEGTVVAVGAGKYEDGTLVTPEVAVGDLVLYSKYGGTEVTADGTDYVILDADQILAVRA